MMQHPYEENGMLPKSVGLSHAEWQHYRKQCSLMTPEQLDNELVVLREEIEGYKSRPAEDKLGTDYLRLTDKEEIAKKTQQARVKDTAGMGY